ncbi:MAG: hypothetical protein K9M10_02785 [Candidatus Pacebacteria bacterium]|nr:hypothetical protein [Candidatus Paceibacterota bacterium]
MPEEQKDAPEVEMHTPEPMAPSHPAHVGPILGVLIIMLVLILGGLYLWGGTLTNEVLAPIEEPIIINNEPETPRAEADTQILETLSPSDDLGAIEADIDSTNFDSLETDLTSFDVELQGI